MTFEDFVHLADETAFLETELKKLEFLWICIIDIGEWIFTSISSPELKSEPSPLLNFLYPFSFVPYYTAREGELPKCV